MPGSTVHLSLRFSKNWSEKRGGAALGTALPTCSSDHYVTPPPFCQEPTRIIACLINIEFHGQLLGFSHYQVPSPSPAPHSGQACHFPVSPASHGISALGSSVLRPLGQPPRPPGSTPRLSPPGFRVGASDSCSRWPSLTAVWWFRGCLIKHSSLLIDQGVGLNGVCGCKGWRSGGRVLYPPGTLTGRRGRRGTRGRGEKWENKRKRDPKDTAMNNDTAPATGQVCVCICVCVGGVAGVGGL